MSTAALVATTEARGKDACRALCMSGGGSNGAWELGTLYGFVHNGDPADFTFDVLTGVSAGSINAAGMAGWEIGNEVAMTEWMSNLWMELKTSDVYVQWDLGLISGLLLMGGVVDNSPLQSFMMHVLAQYPEGYKKRVTISAANVETGEFHDFDQTDTTFSELAFAAHSSASIPGVFPPHKWIKRGTFMDGGTVWNINTVSAVEQCRELVDDDSKIIIDAYIIGGPGGIPTAESDDHVFENYMRGRDLKKYYGSTD